MFPSVDGYVLIPSGYLRRVLQGDYGVHDLVARHYLDTRS